MNCEKFIECLSLQEYRNLVDRVRELERVPEGYTLTVRELNAGLIDAVKSVGRRLDLRLKSAIAAAKRDRKKWVCLKL